MDELRHFVPSARTVHRIALDTGDVTQVASELQRRLSELTSTWTGAPVEVHRIQETVSRTCMVLQSIVRSGSNPYLDGASSAIKNHQSPIYKPLRRQLAATKKLLQSLIDILAAIQTHQQQDAAGINRRWVLRRDEAAALRVSLSESTHRLLAQLSMLEITVATEIRGPSEGLDAADCSGNGPRGDTASAQAVRDNSSQRLRSPCMKSAEIPPTQGNAGRRRNPELPMDAEFGMKFRNVAFADFLPRVNHGTRDWDRRHVDEDDDKEDVQESGSDSKACPPFEEQKVLKNNGAEPKSGPRVLAKRQREQQTQRRSHNEKEFQHLEQVFEMVFPFGYQPAGAVPSAQGLDLIHRPNQSRLLPPAYSESLTGLRNSGHRDLAERSAYNLERCSTSCLCACHLQVHTRKGFLSAFRSTIGSFTFIFSASTTSCNLSTCLSRKEQYFQIAYRFPSWLLHAAISATLKDWTMGSPELLLRVHRRVDPGMMAISNSIFNHIIRGDVGSLRRALSRREATVYDVSGKTGVSTLYTALRLRQLDCVELLLHEGADVFQLDDVGLGPYHEAIQAMYTSASGPFLNRLYGLLPMDRIIEAAQLTSLHKIAMGILWASVAEYVVVNGSADVNAGDNISQTPLFYAAARGNTAVVQALLDADAYPDAVPVSSASHSWTPLSMAARNGHLAVVERLLAAGADVNKRSKHNRTALHECAPSRGNKQTITSTAALQQQEATSVAIAQCLLSHGAALDVVDSYGSTVLDTACIADWPGVASFLIDSGIDTTHRDWEGSTALSNCIVFDSVQCAAVLLALGAERSGAWNVDENGLGVLHYLAASASVRMLELFAACAGRCGLHPELRDGQGRTALAVLGERTGVGEELRATFMRCLWALSRPEGGDGGGQEGDSDLEDVDEEFFDVDEF